MTHVLGASRLNAAMTSFGIAMLLVVRVEAMRLGAPHVLPQHTPRPIAVRACIDGGSMDGSAFWDGLIAEVNAEGEALGISIDSVTFISGKLAVVASGAGVDELQQLNSQLSNFIDTYTEESTDELPPFLLEVASPGLSDVLESDLDFTAFKGFPVTVTTTEEFKKKTSWEGTLVGRDDESLTINLKGRAQKIPIGIVAEVRMPSAKTEQGDMCVS